MNRAPILKLTPSLYNNNIPDQLINHKQKDKNMYLEINEILLTLFISKTTLL